jgi:hypothetical protein
MALSYENPKIALPQTAKCGKDHGIWEKHGRSLERYVQAHRAPDGEPWGSWRVTDRMSRWYDTYAALDPEQQAQLAEVARRMWPDDWRD